MSDVRLIDANALLKEFEKRQKAAVDGVFADCFLNDAQNLSTEWWMVDDIVEAAPTIDAVPVVHGRWEWGQCGWFCTACGQRPMVEAVAFAKYCHRCGAKMDAKEG